MGQWRLQVERARYETERSERRYRSVEPENRLVARTLEAEWESRLSKLEAAEAELARRQRQHPGPITDEQRTRLLQVLAAAGVLPATSPAADLVAA